MPRISQFAVASMTVLVLAGATNAQPKPTAPLVLRLPASTRGLSLGDINVASTNDDVIFYNPAQLATARSASASVQQFDGSIAGALSASMAFNTGGIGIGAQWLSFDAASPMPFSPTSLTQRNGTAAGSVVATLGVAQVIKGLRIGVSGKVAQEIAGAERSHLALADIGVAKDLRGFIATGLAVRNLGAATTIGGVSVTPPTRLTLAAQAGRPIAFISSGLSPFIDVGAAAELSVLRDGWLKPAAGLEIGYAWIDGYSLSLRGGVRRPELGEKTFTAGAGLIADRLRLDYALEPREGGSLSHRFGLRIR